MVEAKTRGRNEAEGMPGAQVGTAVLLLLQLVSGRDSPLLSRSWLGHEEQDGLPAFEKENITRKGLQGRIILKKVVRCRSRGKDTKYVTGDCIMMMPFVPLCTVSLCHLLRESHLGMPGPDKEWKPLSLHVCLK